MRQNRRSFLLGLSIAALSSVRSAAAEKEKPLFRIGAIADSQYADADDAPPRLYRRALEKFRAAVADLNKRDLKFEAHLGDYIDRDWQNFATLRPVADGLKHPWRFVLGNHDFNVADDKKLAVPAEFGLSARYYSFEQDGWLFVVLDGNDNSTYAWPAGSRELAISQKLHDEKYPTAKPWNGGIGEAQLQWLDETLDDADARGQKAMILCHFPIWPQNDPTILLWNAGDVVALLEKHPSVKIWLDGHDHNGNYAEKSGIHYLNLKGMLDTEQTAYAVIDFYPDRLEVQGFGREQDRTLMLRP